MRAKVALAAFAVLAVAATSVYVGQVARRTTARDLSSVGSVENPIVFVLSPSHAEGMAPAELEVLGAELSRAVGASVIVRVPANPRAAIEAFEGSTADVGLLTLVEYLLARREFQVEPRLQVLRQGLMPDTYAGELVVRADSGIENVGGLRGGRVAFVDEYSMSGFILPASLLSDVEGIVSVFAGSHQRALEMLRAGSVDAAATFLGGSAGDATLRVLVTTKNVPNEPVFVRSRLPHAIDSKLMASLIELAQRTPGVIHKLGDARGFKPIDDRAYEPARHAVNEAGKQIEDLVVDGRAIVRWNLPVGLDPGLAP